jgi:hypothetical protein
MAVTPFTFALSLTVLAALLLVLLIRGVQRAWRALFVLVPLALLLAAVTIYTVNAIMARPLTELPADEFTFLEYATDGQRIFIWLAVKGKDYPLTVERPYSRKLHEELEKARAGKKQGKRMQGKVKNPKEPWQRHGSATDSEDELLIYDFVPVAGDKAKDEGVADQAPGSDSAGQER